MVGRRKSQAAGDGILRAGTAHFYLVTIHPFADGNGRLARVLTDMALGQDDQLARRYIFFKTEFWRRFRSVAINSRQQKVINRLLDAGRDKFVGGLTTRKYVSIVGASRRTAIREIQNLLSKGMLRQNEGLGRLD